MSKEASTAFLPVSALKNQINEIADLSVAFT